MSVADRAGSSAPGRSPTDSPTDSPTHPDAAFEQVRSSAEFQALRASFRRVVFPTTAAFLLWYATYVLLAAFAPGFMATQVVGNINIGLLLGLGQFVSTFAITMAYRRWADQRMDPAATALRERIEGSR